MLYSPQGLSYRVALPFEDKEGERRSRDTVACVQTKQSHGAVAERGKKHGVCGDYDFGKYRLLVYHKRGMK